MTKPGRRGSTRPGGKHLPEYGDWRGDGKCHGMPIVDRDLLFFPEQGFKADEAKAFCSDCPVKLECLEYAIPIPDLVGIFGGSTEADRIKARARRGLTQPIRSRV